jgi:hypothetical protein
MLKTLSLYNMSHKRGAGLLIPTYFVLGIALVPTGSLVPGMRDVQNVTFKECHRQCHVEKGKQVCVWGCSWKSTTTAPVNKHVVHGSTGPTKPVPPKTSGAKHY